MSDMRFSLPGADSITLSSGQIDKLVRRGDGDAALLYLYILRKRGVRENAEMAKALGKTEDEIESSMRVLCAIGLLEGRGDEPTEEGPDPDPREYTAEDVAAEAARSPEFVTVKDEAARMLGHLLSGDDLKKLLGIYRDLNLPAEVILTLITFCIEESRRKTDPTHIPTMRYIEKTAYEWERSHIFTIDAAEDYIKRLSERRSAMSRVRRMLGISDRRLTKSEENYLHSWLSLGFSPEAISAAYERTVDRTGKLAWRYMDSILNSWHSKGIHTESEIEAKESRRKAPKREDRTAGARPDTADRRAVPNIADVERLKRLLNNMKEEE